MNVGQNMYQLAERLFPMCRSLTGNGFRESLRILTEGLSDFRTYEIPTGTQVFDWTVPKEWNIRGGYIETLDGKRIIDFADTNLHIMGYSTPIDAVLSRDELLEHVYTQPDQPDWIPYVTSYYKERWGFCMSEKQKQALTETQYHVVIDSELEEGSLMLGDIVIKGETDEEIMFTTYLCHPSMANNELSGPVVWRALIDYVLAMPKRRYTYRFVINPETIGSIAYLSKNFDILKKNLIAGFVLSCVGDNRTYSYVESKYANTIADRVVRNVLSYHFPEYKTYSFLKRGSDERQYCSAGVDLPVCGICRSKYGEYPEYHTSADDMSLISTEGLQGAYEVCTKIINAMEYNAHYQMTCKGEPQLGKRGLYPTTSQKGSSDAVQAIMDFIAYADGSNSLLEISNIVKQPVDILIPIVQKLLDAKLLQVR